jgi:hypothetical protein
MFWALGVSLHFIRLVYFNSGWACTISMAPFYYKAIRVYFQRRGICTMDGISNQIRIFTVITGSYCCWSV